MKDPAALAILENYTRLLSQVETYLKSRGWTYRLDTPGQKWAWEKPDGSWAASWYDALVFESGAVK